MNYVRYLQKCVKFSPKLLFDPHLPLTLDDHSCIQPTWVQVMHQKAHLVLWKDKVLCVRFFFFSCFIILPLMLVCCLQLKAGI